MPGAKQKGKSVKAFSPTSISYDARIFSFSHRDWTISLKLLHNRVRFDLLIGNYQRHLLKGTKPTSATLVKRKDGTYYIHIQSDQICYDPIKSDDVLGVDLGRSDIATTSSGESWSGKAITDKRNHYAKMRAVLQRKATKGTRSSRRRCRQLQKRLSGKEKRYQKWINHRISKVLVDNAATNKQAIVIEDLTGIRERTNRKPRSKKDKRLGNNWAFYQLRQFLGRLGRLLRNYKCLLKGVKLMKINPAYTSQTCSSCHYIGDRNGKRFRCGNCGLKIDADVNGAKNIAASPPGGSRGGLGAIVIAKLCEALRKLCEATALGVPRKRPALGVPPRRLTHPRSPLPGGGWGVGCKLKSEIRYIQLSLWDNLGLLKASSSAEGGWT